MYASIAHECSKPVQLKGLLFPDKHLEVGNAFEKQSFVLDFSVNMKLLSSLQIFSHIIGPLLTVSVTVGALTLA